MPLIITSFSAGCCGEISTMSKFPINLILAGQTFEYKVSNFLDKATESVCGYISVLPGAFSAYRFEALEGAPLQKYFHHIATPIDKLTPFEANQYLAEDRILCFELLAKAGCDYTLHYDRYDLF
jgi:chitin synthase